MRTLIAPWSGATTDWIDGMMGRRLATEGTSVGLGPIRRARVCRFAPFAYIKELATWKAGWKRGTGSCGSPALAGASKRRAGGQAVCQSGHAGNVLIALRAETGEGEG